MSASEKLKDRLYLVRVRLGCRLTREESLAIVAVVEAAERIAAVPSRLDNEDEKLIASRALTALDEALGHAVSFNGAHQTDAGTGERA